MWTTIMTPEEWLAYQARTAKELQLLPERIKWGDGPQSYPCLVCTLFPPRPAGSEPRAYSAFVYAADAEDLLKKAGRLPAAEPAGVKLPNQKQFNRWVAAEMMTVVHFLVETGICREAQFEDKLLEMLGRVDEYHSSKKEEISKLILSHEKTVLDTL